MNVCDALLQVLSGYGVKYIFGIPGDAINELIESIRKQKEIQFIHVMHEEAGAFAASAQAKLSGKLAVCAGTAGPGAIHLLNGLYDAKMDHAPVLAITGQIDTSLLGSGYTQEVNLQSLFQDATVFNQTIIDEKQVPEIITLACQTALSRRSPVHISIPSNISKRKVDSVPSKKHYIFNRVNSVPFKSDLQAAAELINDSEKPLLLAGIGARNAVTELLAFAEKINAPIVKSLRGKDLLADSHPFTLGGSGHLGTLAAVKAMEACDLLIVAGSDFPYHDFYPESSVPTIQIDIDINQIGRRHTVTCALAGDVKLTLTELINLADEKEDDTFLKECQLKMHDWMKDQEEQEFSNAVPIRPQALARLISDAASDDAIICCDTGSVTVWSARHFKIKGGQRFTLSGGLSSMAFGLPAAIGAQLLYPDKQVIALCGDGGFAMLMADFATAVKYELPIKVFVFNNSKLGMIKMEQEAFSGNPEYETDLHNPDYAAFAIACGGAGYTVNEFAELETTIVNAMHADTACIVNVHINKEQINWPPEIDAGMAMNYVKAKIKELFVKN